MQVLNLTIGPNCFNFCVKSDERSVRFSERSFTEKAAKKAIFDAHLPLIIIIPSIFDWRLRLFKQIF